VERGVIQERLGTRQAVAARERAARLLERVGLTPDLARFALVAFAISRLGFILLSLAVLHFYHPKPGGDPNPFLALWDRYDAGLYAGNAVYGYVPWLLYHTAFFPLQSVAMALVRPLVFGSVALAGLVVSNVSFLFALFGVAALVRRDVDADTARRAMVYLTVFPSALFLFAGYAEALFLALAIWCMVALRRRAWLTAAVLGLLASLTRQSGLLLVIPFAWEYAASIGWQWRRVRFDLLAGLLIPGGLLIFMAWLWHAVGDPLAMFHAQASWGRSFTPPWVSLGHAVQGLLQQRDLLSLSRWGADLAVDLLCLGLIVLGFGRIPTSEVLFAAAVWLLAVSYPPTYGWPLLSNARFMLEAFPCLFVLARLTTRRWAYAAVALVFTVGLLILTQYFLRNKLIL
jgi:hypothetical protein